MTSRRFIGRPVAWVLLVLLLLAGTPAVRELAAADEEKPPAKTVEDLPENWRVWLEEEVFPLITKEQKEVFLQLETESQRKAFADRLWSLWGRQTGIGVRFRYVYQERLAMARDMFRHMRSDRARILLIHGPPDFQLKSRCDEIFNPLDIWGWQYIEGIGEDVVVVFYRPDGMGFFRMWNNFDGKAALYTPRAWQELMMGGASVGTRPEYRCMDGHEIVGLIARAARFSRDPLFMRAMYHLPSDEKKGPESSSRRFMEFSALADKDEVNDLDFRVAESERDLSGGKIRMNFDLRLPTDKLDTTEVGDVDVVQVDVVGEISDQERMVDRFRYLFSVPKAGDELVLLIDRFLRPGAYTARLKVEDVHSSHVGVVERPFVASLESARIAREEELKRRSRKAQAPVEVEVEDQPILSLVGPQGEAVSGIQRFEAVALQGISRVRFLLDGQEILTKNKPPFDIDLDLGPLPRLRTVTAVALNASGVEVARAETTLNVGRERFFIRLHDISPADDIDGDRMRVRVTMNTPTDAKLDRLELYWNDRQLTTLYQEPFEAWVEIGARKAEMGYLRAVAILDDGSQAEDLRFINAPRFGSIVEVTSVELPVMAIDRRGKPVLDLKAEDFHIFEDKEPQTISHFSLHEDMPIRLGIVIDSSGSMEETLPIVQQVVMGFLRNLLRPRDRAYIEAFSDRPEILATFTADFDTLENALLALYADRTTALYDATIMGLFQFSGVRGRKAMVILTDGEDTSSKYSFDQIKDYIVRSGVTVYTIGIDLKPTQILVRHQLRSMAELSGGRAFFIAQKNELDRIYRMIDQELRTQYLIAYTSNSTRPPDEMREIKIEVDRRGVDVRTISGYYPGGF